LKHKLESTTNPIEPGDSNAFRFRTRNQSRLVQIIVLVILMVTGSHAMATKWHPGHYIRATKSAEMAKIYANPDFIGAERNYSWRTLESARGVYDFRVIEDDLKALVENNKKLIIRIDTNGFKNCPVKPGDDGSFEECLEVPDYIKAPSVNGVVYGFKSGRDTDPRAAKAAIWRQPVFDRLVALIQALGIRYDGNSNVVAIKFQETAMGVKENEGGVERGDLDRYLVALKERMRAANSAFPQTPVFQNINFSGFRGDGINERVHLEFLRDFTQTIKTEKLGGIGCSDPAQPTPALPLFEQFKGQIPLASDNQHSPANQDLKLFYRNVHEGKLITRTAVDMYALITDSLNRVELGKSVGRYANYVSWHARDADVVESGFPTPTQPYEQVFSRPSPDPARPDRQVPSDRQIAAVIRAKEANGFPNRDLPEIYRISSLSVRDISVEESAMNLLIPIQLSPPARHAVSVSIATRAGSASPADGDFYGAYEILEFAPGDTQQTFSIAILPDEKAEPIETFTVRLFEEQGATVSNRTATVSIVDDNAAALSVEDAIVVENTGNAYVVVQLSAPSAKSITVRYATDDLLGAVMGVDYYGASGLLTFNPGEVEKIIKLTVLDDNETEALERFAVRIYGPTSANITRHLATVSILDDD